ncbi:GLPGLI family protein [Dinghuibacter silviterrae]|uniref:GLPGLI family protein n=2 Tax=Dinghuibacter silviterrae TaxID=1539049 RepID=A0A4V3GLV5_9BACT|nr:GLPGLI family protein [Dinghuibacter silviterrae]
MRHFLTIALLVFSLPVFAQDSSGTVRFIQAGTIEYERKENLRNEFTGDGDFADEIRKNMPENKITWFNLYFSGNHSLFEPGRENPDNVRMWDAPGSTNIVYADRDTRRQVSQKQMWGSTLLLSDSLRTLHWRITADTRVIAGFECHRATTVIMDSVFVVVFYTDEILSPAGPESFGDLPGMILGMVIPKLHTSWYATKVVLGEPKQPMQPPKKGQKMGYTEMLSTLRDSFKDWGDWAKPMVMRIML